MFQAVTKRAQRKKEPTAKGPSSSRRGKETQQVKKAVFESTKKKEVGVSDLTLISKITNEAINDNLKKRFENREIYVGWPVLRGIEKEEECGDFADLELLLDIHRPCAGFC